MGSGGPDIFLSYNRENQPRAKLFAKAFERQDPKVWRDTALTPGEACGQVTEKALREVRAAEGKGDGLLTFVSRRSIKHAIHLEFADRSTQLVSTAASAQMTPTIFAYVCRTRRPHLLCTDHRTQLACEEKNNFSLCSFPQAVEWQCVGNETGLGGLLMRRRDFVAYGSASALTATFVKQQFDQQAEAQAGSVVSFELHMEEIFEEMIDGEVIYAMAYRDPVSRALRPPLRVGRGATVSIKLVNKTRRPRRFALTGYAPGLFPIIPSGATSTIQFAAGSAGTHLYHEDSEGATGRVVGLHGAFIITPGADCLTPEGSYTPYQRAGLTPSLIAIFDEMGRGEFPGGKWDPFKPTRERIWMMGSIDPAINAAAERGGPVDLSLPIYFFRPRYFTINGLSGYDSSHDEQIVPKGYVGEPCLIRTLNAGLCTHGPHIHGNHVFGLTDVDSSGKCVYNTNVLEFDTWTLPPLSRKDVLLPFKKPDEIPAAAWPPKEEPWPLLYPMHCHIEMSQTASGGQYPQGMVTHWELQGPSRGVAV